MSKYTPVVGLEVHVQAKTNRKNFSPDSAQYFGDEPNTHVSPTSLGLPGALPVPNQAAVDQIIKLALALNCQINQYTRFERKNYFYPDLPKGYQITQNDYPIGIDGYLEIPVGSDSRRIRIKQIHLEEDTGKSIHDDSIGGGVTLLDYNKSGVALIEIVTQPDFQSAEEIINFSKLLKQTVTYLGVSDAEMQKGQMRFELNISLRTPEDKGQFPDYRIEVKNIGSISALEKAYYYEIERQTAEIDAGKKMVSQTRGLKDMSGVTVLQRTKESADDYRYFPEPDIPPFIIADERIKEIKAQIPELPVQRIERYQSMGLELQQAEMLTEYSDKGDWVDGYWQSIQGNKSIDTELYFKEAVKWFTGEISAYLEKDNLDVSQLKIQFDDITDLITMMQDGKISGTITKKVIQLLFEEYKPAAEIIAEKGLIQVTDDSQLEAWIDQVIEENAKIVESIEKNPNAIKALVGKTMAMSKGKANPQRVTQLLEERFSN